MKKGLSVPAPTLQPRVALGLGLASVLLTAQALDWPIYRGPQHNGISQETGWSSDWPAEGPKVLWRARTGIGFSSFSVANGRVYTLGNAGKAANQDSVYCFDAVSGQELWRHTYDEKLEPKYYDGGPSATPTVHDNRVYTLSKTGRMLCLAADTGKVLWDVFAPEAVKAKTGEEAAMPTWGFSSSVLPLNDRLYVNVGTYGSAFDLNGKLIWTTGSVASGYSSFVPFTMQGKHLLAVFGMKAVAAVDPDTGTVEWTSPWETQYDVNAADPIIQGNEVFISSGYGTGASVIRITDRKPQEVWRSKTAMRNQHNTCILIDGFLYGFDGDNNSDFKCLEFATGKERWSHKGLGKGALTAADGKLIINSEQGELVIAKATPTAYEEIARAQILGKKCWSAPVLANGRIYLRNEKGDVACVDVSR